MMRSRQKMMLCLPYGVWIERDGWVLFNRKYQPIWRITMHNKITAVHPDERINYEKQEFLYNDSNPPWLNRDSYRKCRNILNMFGIPEDRLPLAYMIARGLKSND